jgi:hypothetical protein
VNYDRRLQGEIMGSDLNNRHRDTLHRILNHPASGNIGARTSTCKWSSICGEC